ncbi:hypothetical protein MHYP_G00014670 [Metynnis hypsauchen]
MTWPPQSPDLNPIEMVWGELDLRVKAKGPTSAKHLWELLQDCWKTISVEELENDSLKTSTAPETAAEGKRELEQRLWIEKCALRKSEHSPPRSGAAPPSGESAALPLPRSVSMI